MNRRPAERGAGTVLALGIIGAVLVLTGGLAALGAAQNGRGAAQSAADLGALAGAAALRGGHDACATATAAVARNGSEATSCTVPAVGVVRVEVRRAVALTGRWSSLGAARADARAGPRSARVGAGQLGAGQVAPGPATPGRSAGLAGAARNHRNGELPSRLLCDLSFAPGQELRCDAAVAIESLNVAFRAAFGRDLAVRGSYRSYAAQVAVAASKGALAAPPGTSNHGWGEAIDLGGGIQYFGTAEHRWMVANAGAYGWIHPSWAGPGGSKPEAWHWEYRAGS
ncbi:Rv3654c family TadE-like protein [Myceligenerans xiligouense]|uniref:Rv3654c family TadE-like protein n=1 Tax=Myceligenerans xiligouense TaxID=253184 RepID=UPI001FEBEF1A|nr:Rv3654c family TadE-like protein [Myceligenerans xiligouense]